MSRSAGKRQPLYILNHFRLMNMATLHHPFSPLLDTSGLVSEWHAPVSQPTTLHDTHSSSAMQWPCRVRMASYNSQGAVAVATEQSAWSDLVDGVPGGAVCQVKCVFGHQPAP